MLYGKHRTSDYTWLIFELKDDAKPIELQE